MAPQISAATEFSVAMTEPLDRDLRRHLDKGPHQEDLTFATWRPVTGRCRTTAVLSRLLLPGDDERILQGNVAFTADYLSRALSALEVGEGLALIHCHFGPGWQGMSEDDVVAERDRLAGACFGRTGLPVVGLTSGTDGSWSARRWVRSAPNVYAREDASVVRVVGRRLRLTFHPKLRPAPRATASQAATVSVWGDANQADLVRTRVAIVGLGSVGSLVAESLGRMGIVNVVAIDHDHVEERNLDRTAGAIREDAEKATPKVDVAKRNFSVVSTAASPNLTPVRASVLSAEGHAAVLDTDIIFCCVDRPWPRHLLNGSAYSALIPVVDGGIFALVDGDKFVHADWRIHTIGPGRACLVCLKALDPADISLDIAGQLDNPDYIKNLPKEKQLAISRRNVFPFSMAVAAHAVLQFVGCVTGLDRVGGVGPQAYHCYPGEMTVTATTQCEDGCPYAALTATAGDMSGNLDPKLATDSAQPSAAGPSSGGVGLFLRSLATRFAPLRPRVVADGNPSAPASQRPHNW